MSIEEIMQTFGFHINNITMDIEMISAHAHNYYEIYYLTQGSRTFFIDNSFSHIDIGDFILIPARKLHRTAGGKCTRINLTFSKSYLQRFYTPKTMHLLLAPFSYHRLRPLKKDSERAFEILTQILALFPDRDDRISLLLAELLNILSSARIITETEHSDEENKIEKIVEYTNKNYATINSTKDVANAFYISKEHFCRLFKKNMGIPFSEYLNKTKLYYAAKLLRNTDNSLAEIARMCGFHTSTYFCKVFKLEHGMTPLTYRRNHK